jgi:rhamnosyltransferase
MSTGQHVSERVRHVLYTAFVSDGRLSAGAFYALAALRTAADGDVTVVARGELSSEARRSLDEVADLIITVPVATSVTAAWAVGIRHLPSDAWSGPVELVVTDDSWFGPVGDLAGLFARMASSQADLWGLTEHVRRNGGAAGRLRINWLVVRDGVLRSSEWEQFWRDGVDAGSEEAPDVPVRVVEEHLNAAGFGRDVAFPGTDFDSLDPALCNPDLLVAAGCPMVDRICFDTFPSVLNEKGVVPRNLLRQLASAGYPADLILRSLVKTTEPRVLYTNAAMHEVLPYLESSDRAAGRSIKALAALHIFYPEMTDEMVDLVERLPCPYDLVITTPDEAKRQSILDRLAARSVRALETDVRVLASNDGRDQSAFLIGCRDRLTDPTYDLVVKLHSKKTPQDGFNVGRHFREQQFLNLLATEGYAANLVALFEREPGLGIVYPPMIHIGYPTLGRGWWSNKPGFATLARTLGVEVPLDEISPLAPFGSMYVARPAARRRLVDHPWSFADFGGAEAYRDGGLAHVLERMPTYVAAQDGYYTRTVSTRDYFAISHTMMEYALDEVAGQIPGGMTDRIASVKRAGYVGHGTRRDFVRMYLAVHPRIARMIGVALPLLRRSSAGRRRARGRSSSAGSEG